LFEDVGTAQLVDGLAVIAVDPKFAETVNLNVPYQVFLTPRGDCGLYLAETTSTSFTVRALGGAKCSLDFDYRIVAKRLGYEDARMAPAVDPNLAIQNSKPPEEPQP
jgi:ABC-type sulfate transport system permease component